MNVLSVDPGIRGCGCAVWIDGKLSIAEYVKNAMQDENGLVASLIMASCVVVWLDRCVDGVILEFPQTYGGRASKGDANDLFPLACIDGAIAEALISVNNKITVGQYTPHQWKGSIGKPKNGETYIIESRIRDRLSDEELSRIVWPKAKKLTWDVSDAIGLGLFFLGRFGTKRGFARD